MKIEPQTTKAVRLTETSARRLKTFAGSLSNPARNMNGSRNQALWSLPENRFVDETLALEQDRLKSLMTLRERFGASGALTRGEWFFLFGVARDALRDNELPIVKEETVVTILRATERLWALVPDGEKHLGRESWLMGNLAAFWRGRPVSSLSTFLAGALDAGGAAGRRWPCGPCVDAIANPEALLQDFLWDASDAGINEALHDLYSHLFRMAARWIWRRNGRAIGWDEPRPLGAAMQRTYGRLSVSQMAVGHVMGVIDASEALLTANNVVELDDFVAAFERTPGPDYHYRSKAMCVFLAPSARWPIMIQMHPVSLFMEKATFEEIAASIRRFRDDAEMANVLEAAYDRHGNL